MRFGRDKYQRHEPLLAAIGDAVILPRRRQGDLAGAELALLIADDKYTAPLEHVINFTLARVSVSALALPGLETLGVAEKVIGFEDAVFFHLLRGELHGVGKFFEIVHDKLLIANRDTITGLPACKSRMILLSLSHEFRSNPLSRNRAQER